MRVVLLIDLPLEAEYRRASFAAVQHAIDTTGVEANIEVVGTSQLTGEIEQLGVGMLIGPGAPYDDPTAANNAIRQARENNIPLVGT